MTTLALAAFLATLLWFGYRWHRALLRAKAAETLAAQRATELDQARADIAHERACNERLLRNSARAVRKYAEAALDADRNAVALRGLLTHAARADVLRPDEPCGQSNVIEVPAGRWAR